MTITYTGNLKLALPTTGTEAGTWGDVVNQQLTSLLDQSVAGTVSLTSMTNADYTLTNGNGSAPNEARYMALLVPSSLTLTAARNIIVPASSKAYIIRNLTTGGFAVTLKTSAGTGISVPNGKTMILYCDGTNVIDGTDYFTSITVGALTASNGTANGVAYLNGSKVLTTGSALTFDGTNLGLGGSANNYGANIIYQSIYGSTDAGLDFYNGATRNGYISTTISDVNFGALTNIPVRFIQNGSERMRLDSSGNLGLGVTPSAWQSVYKAMDVGNSLSLIGGSNSGDLYYNAFINSSGNFIYRATTTASAYSLANGQHRWYTAPSGTAGNAITFSQAMTLDASGNLLVGQTGSTISNTNGMYYAPSASGGGQFGVNHANGIASGSYFHAFGYNGGVIGSINQSGTTGVLYNTTSDYRLKTVLGPVTGAGERIDALKPTEYEWTADGTRTKGFLAHEFQQVYASSVNGEKDAVDADGKPQYQSMQAASSEVIADLVAEIQSLRKRLAALEAK